MINTTTGIVTTVVGNYSKGGIYSGDGGLAVNASLHNPHDVALDTYGNIFIANDHDHLIRMVNATTQIITTYAGNYDLGYGFSGDNGQATAAQLFGPSSSSLDTAGNLFIADAGNNVIRMVNKTTKTISSYAGNYSKGAGYSGDGGLAIEAQLNYPTAVAFDTAGNLFIADAGNNVIRMVNSSTKNIITYAGNKATGGTYSGNGGPALNASLSYPSRITFDSSGNLYIADAKNYVVRKVDPVSKIISIFAGDHSGTSFGDGGSQGNGEPAANNPIGNAAGGLAIDTSGNVFIADDVDHIILKVIV